MFNVYGAMVVNNLVRALTEATANGEPRVAELLRKAIEAYLEEQGTTYDM